MKSKTVYFCTNCGNETPKWQGKCPACGAWNTLTEHVQRETGKSSSLRLPPVRQPSPINQVEGLEEIRFSTGMKELDRVLGGGCVKG